jgi:hypothetical protein
MWLDERSENFFNINPTLEELHEQLERFEVETIVWSSGLL